MRACPRSPVALPRLLCGSSLIGMPRVTYRMARRSLWILSLSEDTVDIQRGLVRRYTRSHPNESEPWASVLAMLEEAREMVGSDDDEPAPTGPGRSCWRSLRSRFVAKHRSRRWRALLQPLAPHGGVRLSPSGTPNGPPGGRGGPAGKRGCFPGGAPRPHRPAAADAP